MKFCEHARWPNTAVPADMAACQYTYRLLGPVGLAGIILSSDTIKFSQILSPPMRTTPTATVSSGLITVEGKGVGGGTGSALLDGQSNTERSVSLTISGWDSDLTADNCVQVTSATSKIALDAELLS